MSYRKALALAFLDTIEKQNPKLFARYETALTPIFKDQQKAILRYTQTFQNTSLAGISALTLHYKFSGQMSGWFRKNIAPEKLGLPDHEKRRAWRTDAASIIAEIIEKDFGRTSEKYRRQLASVRAGLNQIKKEIDNAGRLERLSGKTRLASRNLKRMTARQDAINATLLKLFVLRPAFVHYHNPNLEPAKLDPKLAKFQKQLDQRRSEVERQRKANAPNKDKN